MNTIIQFFYNLPSQFPYGLQLYIAGLIFALPIKKRSYPWIRFPAAGAVLLTAAYFIPDYRIVGFIFLPFITLTALTVGAYMFLLDTNPKTIMFCIVSMGLLQHIGETSAYMLRAAFGSIEGDGIWMLCSYISYAVVYPIGCLVIARKMRDIGRMEIKPWKLLFVAATVIVLVYFIREITTMVLPAEIMLERFVFFTNNMYPALCCVLAFIILFTFNRSDTLAMEQKMTREMLRREQDGYKTLTANLDSINRKCHDLKYQIAALRNTSSPELRESYIKKLENDVMIYENMPKTGNAALDNTLAEKSLVCERNKIKFTYLVDSDKLDFLDPPDIYSLFGNATDNAIECVLKYEDEEKRIISLMVSASGNMLKIHMENYCEEKLEIIGGKLQTSKNDKNAHGYGLKSILYITEKYGGYMNIDQSKRLFLLDILIPL